ncbi:MAG: L-threonylcarbamoyladenylate synthase [Bacteroidia bacterium]|nr:L-threonylcarbamoyladenylate synthase [Bacteroidia bacterium]MCX7651638.1 L-threonylcarbamoyladenylate synthase [Bacteroidia bacterium]MDW8415964.1 L-threonylcarbamoyladenylate synthase [Bacteroidia bacterium]
METVLTQTVEKAAELLAQGAVVAIPTETVYGLAANALDPVAVEKIFLLKNRPKADPLIVHISGIDALESLGIAPPLWAERLMRLFWPGPLTILLPKSKIIPDIVTAGLPRVALRAPAHPLMRALLQAVPFPLAAPSANPFGHTSPTTAAHVLAYFQGHIPLVLDGGPCSVGIESTIIGEENGRFILYRPGAIPSEALEEALGHKLLPKSNASSPTAIHAPGQFLRHYSPRKPLLYGWRMPPLEPKASIILHTTEESLSHPYLHILSPTGSPQEAAHRLYAALHQADLEPTEYILVQRVSSLEGLREALHDRLRRASVRAIFTIGHSNHSWADFLALLRRYEVEVLVDIRKQPYSKYSPHFSQALMQKALHEAGIAYEWQPNPKRLNFTLARVLSGYQHIALLCAEGEPHRCHRYRLSDELSQQGLVVLHILPEGRLELHRAPISLPLGENS